MSNSTNSSTKIFYADSGINWIFVYEVEYEDDDILVLKDLGRFHKFDEDRKFKQPIAAWIEIGKDWVWIGIQRKLVEVKPS